MTKEEFLEGLHDMVDDINDPIGEMAGIIADFKSLGDEIAEHDPVMAQKAMLICSAVRDLGDYAKSRIEG